MPPPSCPSFSTLKEWKKKEYELGDKLVKEMFSGKHSWADSKQINLFKWASIKYRFNGEYRSPRQLQTSYKTAKQRPSKINK